MLLGLCLVKTIFALGCHIWHEIRPAIYENMLRYNMQHVFTPVCVIGEQ